MNEFEKAFVELSHRINNDPIKVFDDALTYVLCRFSTGAVEVITHRWQDIVAGRDSFEVPRAGALAFDYLVGLGKISPDAARRKRAEAQAAVDVPHPFVAALDNAKADEIREAVVKNNELDIYLRDLYNSGGELRSIGIYNDMPNYL